MPRIRRALLSVVYYSDNPESGVTSEFGARRSKKQGTEGVNRLLSLGHKSAERERELENKREKDGKEKEG